MRTVGYHGTSKYNAKRIIKEGFSVDKCTPREDHWLGRGIYFFKVKKLAEWWVKNIQDKSILSCIIECEDTRVLNLDEFEGNQRFLQKCEIYEKKYKPVFKNRNQYRATMIELYKNDYNIAVVIFTFKGAYGNRFYRWCLTNKDIAKSMKVLLPETQVCVNDTTIIDEIKEE